MLEGVSTLSLLFVSISLLFEGDYFLNWYVLAQKLLEKLPNPGFPRITTSPTSDLQLYNIMMIMIGVSFLKFDLVKGLKFFFFSKIVSLTVTDL